MGRVVYDFETASLTDLKKAGAWRYSECPTTEVLCLSWCLDDGPITTWFPGDPIPALLKECIEDDTVVFVAHNATFEKAIWRNIMVPHFGWPDIPNARIHDTAAKAAMLRIPVELEKVLGVLRLPVEKDMEGNRLTLGLSRLDKKTGMLPARTPEIMARVGTYCEGDVRGQRALLKRVGWLPEGERRVYLIDQEINERGLRLDMPLVRKMRQIVDEASVPLAKEFAELTGGLRMTQRDKVMSWMMDRGVHMPNMTKDTLAAVLGETDEGEEIEADERINLDLPPDVHRALHIRQLIGSSSIKKLDSMEACVCADGRARGLLRYHRAGTGRWAGSLLQPQNFPRGSLTEDGGSINIDPLIDALMTGDAGYVEAIYGPPVEAVVSSLRYAVIAEKDHELVAGDYAGIEARVVLALAGQHDKTALMAAGADVYIDMAQDIFGHPKFDVTDKALCKKFKGEHLEDRQIGKNTVLGCFSAETPVLTSGGWKPIVHIKPNDLLWDGEEWITHQGLLNQGRRQTCSTLGTWATPEHPVLCGEKWLPWEALVQDGRTRSQALETASASYPFSDTPTGKEAASIRSWSAARAERQLTERISDTYWPGAARAVTRAQRSSPGTGENTSTDTRTSSPTKRTGSACLIGSARSSSGARTRKTLNMTTTATEEYVSGRRGKQTARVFSGICSRLMGGISHVWNWIERTMTEDMSRETSGSSPGRSTWETEGPSQHYKPASKSWSTVYDIANAGPRNRFMILTDSGPLIVHNCGFQMGAPKFHDRYCSHQPIEFAEQVIKTYRNVWAPLVPDLWYALEQAAIKTVHYRRPHEAYGMQFALEDEWLTIRLLSGRKLWYFDPRPIRKAMPWDEDDIRLAWTYREVKTGRLITVDAYGGLITENVVQALARDILVSAMFKCRKERLPIVLTVHDELVLELLRKTENAALVKQIMEDVDPWVREIKVPVEVEVWTNDRYKK